MTPATACDRPTYRLLPLCDRYGDRHCYRYATACYRAVYLPPHTPPSARARILPGFATGCAALRFGRKPSR